MTSFSRKLFAREKLQQLVTQKGESLLDEDDLLRGDDAPEACFARLDRYGRRLAAALYQQPPLGLDDHTIIQVVVRGEKPVYIFVAVPVEAGHTLLPTIHEAADKFGHTETLLLFDHHMRVQQGIAKRFVCVQRLTNLVGTAQWGSAPIGPDGATQWTWSLAAPPEAAIPQSSGEVN